MRMLTRVAGLTTRLRADRRGNVAMMFALSVPVLMMMVLGGVDIHRLASVKGELQDALDAATLAAARSPYEDETRLTQVGAAALAANMPGYAGITATFRVNEHDVVIADANLELKTLIANVFLPPYGKLLDDTLPVSTHSEVNRSSQDIEVALVLDITGSMSGSRLTDLKTAAKDLVGKVIPEGDVQSINRTRVALAPYSMGVNVGDYATTVRGGIRGQSDITAAAWTTGSAKSISGASSANPAEIRSNGHGLATDDYVWISGLSSGGSGSSLANKLNGKAYRVVKVDNNRIRLQSWTGSTWATVSTSGYDAYSSGGVIRKCLVSTCEVVVTSRAHGLVTGEDVRIASVRGMTRLNSDAWSVTRLTDDTFIAKGAVGPTIDQTYSSNGYAQCLELGCQYYKFTNYYGSTRIQQVSTCVSERVGPSAYSEDSPATSHVGLVYPSSDNGCLSSQIKPLTDDRSALTTAIDGYSAVGSTAGQIGIEWGWYMVSPTFGSIFGDGAPDPYEPTKRIKVVVLMTDGEFNTPYCSGVVAGAVSGSGDVNQHIRCDEYTSTPLKSQPADRYTNPFARSVETCRQMKAAGVVVYTVGFDITGVNDRTPNTVDTAQEVMAQCATDAQHAYLPETGSELKNAFNEIGQSISKLRISR